MEISYLIFVFVGTFSNTIGSTVKPEAELCLEETVRQLSAKVEEMEVEKLESRNWRNDLSAKLQELEQRTIELQNAESRFQKVDEHLLLEVHQLKPMLKVAVEKVRSVEEQVTSVIESQRQNAHSLQVKVTEMNSELLSVDMQVNDRLSNVTRNMRIFENSTLNFLKGCANSSYVSELDENLKNLEKNVKNELGTLQSELSARLEKLEGRSVLSDNVLEMNKTLTNHSSLFSRLSQHIWEVENTCSGEPPSILNGKPLKFDRQHKSVVQYECDQDFFLIGNSTVFCEYNKWKGHPPICSFFDTTFTLVADFLHYHTITCYSDKYSQNIEFSRVADTGTGKGLPRESRQQGPVLNLIDTEASQKIGAYECRFHVENRSAGIVVLFLHLRKVLLKTEVIAFPTRYQRARIGGTSVLSVGIQGYVSKSELRWRHNGVLVPSWDGQTNVRIRRVQPADAGIYECFEEGKRTLNQDLLRLIARNCERNRYGVNCELECPVCYNGGICHDLVGVCICPMGFTGKNCESACGENDVSGDCGNICSRDHCMYKLFCKPDPFGCSCFPGLQGAQCRKECEPGWYGAGCKQPCHCDGDCDIYTGACSGACSPGWNGPSCQIKDVN